MTTIIAINEVDTDHLAEVVAEMREMGAPTIRGFWTGEVWRALEGSHRIAAAAELGLTPNMVHVEETEEIETDIDHDDWLIRGTVTAAEILEFVELEGPVYEF